MKIFKKASALFVAFFLVLGVVPASAITVEVIGKNNAVLFKDKLKTALPSTVGQVTVEVLDRAGATYTGGDYGIAAMFDLGQDIDVISDTEMKAYGWCFSINGLVPETMPDATTISSNYDHIVWYYAYAHYKGGEWIGQCVQDKL